MQINILESKNRLSQLVRRAQQGEEVIIANRGVPMVKLVPVLATAAEPKRDVLVWLQSHPVPVRARRNHAEIQHDLRQEREAWG